jgi:glycosyltransferase involved in cell wall biosynthesis
MNPLTTFVIPTIGRQTLKNAVDSIIAQTINNWKCIIACDGIPIAPYFLSPEYFKVSQISIPKIANAGKVRNLTFPLISTPWISFLDDDDALNIFYMYWLNRYIKEDPDLDCIIFTMCYADGYKHPKDTAKTFTGGDVGISFSVKMDFIIKHNLLFDAGKDEDYALLSKIRKLGGKIKISEKEMYYIRPYLLHTNL